MNGTLESFGRTKYLLKGRPSLRELANYLTDLLILVEVNCPDKLNPVLRNEIRDDLERLERWEKS